MKLTYSLFSLLIIFSILVFSPTISAQSKTKKSVEMIVKDDKSSKADSTKKKVTIAAKVKSSTKIEGLFTLYQDTVTGKLQMLIKNDQLDKEFIYQSFSMGGPPSLFLNQNMLRETWVYRMEKVFDKLHFIKVNTNFYFEPDKAISKSANVDASDATFYSTKVIAKDSTSSLIEVDKLFLSNVLDQIKPNFPPSVKPGAMFNIGKINKDKSYYHGLKSFPQNTDVIVSLSFDNPAPKNGGGKTISDARYVEVKMQHSFLEMPDNDYKPRFDDPRVGYFTQQMDNMSTTDFINYHDVINRWRLVKKDPNAALSEPVNPIVWWVENTTPKEYRQLILEAGLKWNFAFEKAGFKNAVVMKMMPDTASWDPADIRYNVIRWVSSDLGFAIGPSFVNPRTGEILGADITVDLGMLSFTLAEETISDVAFGAYDFSHESEIHSSTGHKYCNISHGKKMQQGLAKAILSSHPKANEELKKLSEQFITELILHEMGHTMGLGHNMKGSQMLSPEELHNTTITREFGVTSSIMDYTIVNVHSNPEKQGDYYSVTTGPYDWWAIEYGYREFADDKEEEGLKSILSRSSDPRLDYGNDSDIVRQGKGVDPRVMVWDQSNDIVEYATDRFKLVNNTMDKLHKSFVKPDKSYQELYNYFFFIQRDRYSMSNALSRYIGGIYVDRSFPGQNSGNLPYTPVPYEYQKKAMKLLTEKVFAPNAYSNDQKLYPYLQKQRRGWDFGKATEDPKIQNYILGIQNAALKFILDPVTLTRVNTSQMYGNKYAVAEILDDLKKACFEADNKGDVSLFRQNLQKDYVKRLISIFENKGNRYDHASNSAAFYSLDKLSKMLKKSKSKGNIQSQAHRQSLLHVINKSLKIDK